MRHLVCRSQLTPAGLRFKAGFTSRAVLYGGVVQEHHWLTDHQFVDAVAVAMITPGPVVITVAFIGYLIAGRRSNSSHAGNIFASLSRLYCWPRPKALGERVRS